MADEKDKAAVEAKLNEELTKATTPDEIRDVLLAQPRDEKGQFAAKPVAVAPVVDPPKVDPPEVTVYKDTFLIGGKEVEFTGDSIADVLKQAKVALQGYEIGRPKVEAPKPPAAKEPFTPEELASLGLRMSTGDPAAIKEYVAKSGVIDDRLKELGFDPDRFKTIVADHDADGTTKLWGTATEDFIKDNPDWPGGQRNMKLLGQMMKEIRNEQGKSLAETPSKESLQKAYEALKADDLLWSREEEVARETKRGKPPETTPAVAAPATPPTPKRAPTGSTAFGTSQESGTRRASPTTPQVPTITDDMTPQQIMEAWKQQVVAEGKSPDDALRTTYAGRA